MKKFKVKFYPDNKECLVEQGTSILAAAISAGVHINSSCGGDGVCGRCKVILKNGNVVSQPTGRISLAERKKGYHLACLSAIHSDIEIEVPEESRMGFEKLSPQEMELRLRGLYAKSDESAFSPASEADKTFEYSPLSKKVYLELSGPDLNDKVSDLERIYQAISRSENIPFLTLETGLANIRQLGELLRSSEWKVTVTLTKKELLTEIVLIEPGNTADKNYGIAFDIGTTTLTGQLVNLHTREVLGTKIEYNRQAAFGSDIITRIIFAKEPDGLEKLHHAVIDGMNEIIAELVEENNVDLNTVTSIVCAGNTTMIHLLLRVDPTYIRREPYVPTANFVPLIRAIETGIKINPRGILFCVPGVSSYLGGDITSGILSCGIAKEKDLSLLIDIGTNGEIVLGNKDFLVGCAASAGPAFEGSGVSCGMRAAKGAIQEVKINPQNLQVNFSTILGEKPKGICGSGYIDLLAEMLQSKIIDKNGKIILENNPRLYQTGYGKEFVVVFKQDSASGKDITINEMDIDNLKRAKAAIYAALSILLKHMGYAFADIKKIFIAGGFSTYLNVENAIKIGLLPDLPREKFIFVGNSSLSGARSILLSHQALKESKEIAKKITYFELSTEPNYMDEYIAALFFPHTDLSRFATIKL